MKTTIKPIITLLAALTMISLASATSFGTIQLESEKTIEGLNSTYKIGVINPGNQTLEVKIENEPTEGLKYTYPEQNYTLEPEPLRSEPEGSGWVNINDRYAKLEQIPFQVEINETKGIREYEFSTTIEAQSIETNESENQTRQDIVQQREYTHRLKSSSTQIQDDPDFSDELWGTTENNQTEQNHTEINQQNEDQTEEEQTSLTNQTQEQIREEGINTTTKLMIALTLTALLYLIITLLQ